MKKTPGKGGKFLVIGAAMGGFSPQFGVSAKEISGATVALEDFLGSWARELQEKVFSARSDKERFRAVHETLLALRPNFKKVPDVIQESVREVWRAGGNVSVNRLASSNGVTRQCLTRLFRHWIGLSFKDFAKIVRLRTSMMAMSTASERINWADFAVDRGYYDQAHLINSFQEVVGMTPADIHARESGIPIVETNLKVAPKVFAAA